MVSLNDKATEEIRPLALEMCLICDENGIKHDYRQVMKFGYCRTYYNLNVLNISPIHYSRQVVKCVFWRSTCNLSVLNTGSKNDSLQVKKFDH